MYKHLALSAVLAVWGTATLACTPEDVEARQTPLISAIQQLLAINPAKAQAIVLKMQQDMDKALAEGDEAATCRIMDEALAAAQS